ncbi:MAG: ribosome biogenesis GTP-binding protein YsxC [Bdellovibrionales bacterium RIFOXYD1_FULL_44_7]|nr:MAG: ribosome biogenesis GTP-binding protein YsxC [Bdellovibrionales bacterium RIFOXYD1_FULL_44_7]
MNSDIIFTAATKADLIRGIKGKCVLGHPEKRIIMVGRSNVGKSSLINVLVEAEVARTSQTPGKTRLIHFYLWPSARRIIADLPGYGYAKVSMEERERWAILIKQYLQVDDALDMAIVVLDARHGPTEIDIQAIDFLSFSSIPITFVMTKVDSVKNQAEKARRTNEVKDKLKAYIPEGTEREKIVWVSSRTKEGIKALRKILSA